MAKKLGRPTIYTDELAEEICAVIATSSDGLRGICKSRNHFPNPDTIYSWVANNPIFSERYARAKRAQINVLTDEIIDIAKDESKDTLINKDGNEVSNNAAINRARLIIDTFKWTASKLAPKVWGDKVSKDGEESSHENNLDNLE